MPIRGNKGAHLELLLARGAHACHTATCRDARVIQRVCLESAGVVSGSVAHRPGSTWRESA